LSWANDVDRKGGSAMLAIVEPIHIDRVYGNGAAHFGGVFPISPKSVDYSAGGSGTYNAGDLVQFFNSPNVTFVWDLNLISQQKSFNA
jgi:spore germination protein PA